jgi:hypothetical protein
MGQHLAQLGKHRRICEVKEEATGEEENEGSIQQQGAPPALGLLFTRAFAAGASIIDLLRIDPAEDEERRCSE